MDEFKGDLRARTWYVKQYADLKAELYGEITFTTALLFTDWMTNIQLVLTAVILKKVAS